MTHKGRVSRIAKEYLRIRDIPRKFASLFALGLCKLQGKIVDMRRFRVFLIPFYSPKDDSDDSRAVDASDFVDKVLGSAQDLSDVFVALSQAGLLNYTNYGILRSIIIEYASDDQELNQQMREYEDEVAGYALVTSMKDYVDAELQQCEPAEVDPELLSVLSLKVGESVTEHTLQYVKEVWDSLASRLKLPQSALLFEKIADGCIEMTWILPSHLTNFVIRQARENTEYFIERRVLRVIIANRCIYDGEAPIHEITNEKKDPGRKVGVSIQWFS